MNIRDLGEMPERLVLFGGAYGNLQALEALLLAANGQPMINTGDMVAYCADGAAVLQSLANIPCVAGNVEKQLGNGEADCGCGFEPGTVCDLLSAGWYAHAVKTVDEQSKSIMKACPDMLVFTQAGKRFAVVHGGATDVARFLWSTSSAAEFTEEINAVEAACGRVDAIVAGHSGIAFERRLGRVTWINAGVIGMPPNNGLQATEYVILENGVPHLMQLHYDAHAARAAMVSAGLTQGYHDALITGYWPSEDVLPLALRRENHTKSADNPSGP